MQLEGSYTFGAPVAAVWEALMDPAVLAQALPGGEELVKVSDNEYQAVMNVRIGPVQGRFEGRIELADIVAQQGYRMKVSGQGAPGFVSGEGRLALAPHGDDGALLTYSGDVQIGGKIAGISQRLVESSAKSLTRQGLQALNAQIQARMALALELLPGDALPGDALPGDALPGDALPGASAPEAGEWQPLRAASRAAPEPIAAGAARPASPAGAPAPRLSTASVLGTTLKDVTRDLASDYIPPAQQEKALWAALGALGMLLFVVLVRLVQKR